MRFSHRNISGTVSDPNIKGLLAMARRKRDHKTKDLFVYAEDNRPSIVYMATNQLDGSRYIGVTRLTLEKRRRAHLREAQYGIRKHASRFYKAIRRDGFGVFIFEVIAHCESFRAAALEEMRLIAELKPEYNLSPGGDGVAHLGVRASDETRKKQSIARLQNPNRYWLGKKRPDIADNQRLRLKGNPALYAHWLKAMRTPEAKAKARATRYVQGYRTPRFLSAMAQRRKPIICVTDGRVLLGGVPEAASVYGFRYDGIMRVLRGKRPHHRGHVFRYYEDGVAS